MIKSFSLGVIVGLFLGTIGLVIACAACLAIAFTTGSHASLPATFEAWTATVNGTEQIRFLPNFAGMAIALAVWALLCGLFAIQLRSRSHRRNGAAPAVPEG